MTACVNKKSKRVAAVVTASLVGALSIGAPAVALAANANIDMLVAPEENAFSRGDVTLSGGGVSLSDGVWTATANGDGSALEIEATKVKPLGAKEIDINKDDYKVSFAKADGTAVEKVVEPGQYVVTVECLNGQYAGGKATAKLAVKAATLKAVQYYEVNPQDADDVSDGTLTYNGSELKIKFKTADVALVEGVDYSVKVLKKGTDNVEAAPGVTIKDAGEYVAYVTGLGQYAGEIQRVDVPVNKFNLAQANIVVDDVIASNSAPEHPTKVSYTDWGTSVVELDPELVKLTFKSGPSKLFDVKGAYTFVATVDADNANFTGVDAEKTVTVNKVTAKASFKYGDQNLADSYSVNLARDKAFNLDDVKAYNGEDVLVREISAKKTDGTSATSGELAAGMWIVTVSAKGSDNEFNAGGSQTFTVKVVEDAVDADANVFVYYNDEAVTSIEKTFDGQAIKKDGFKVKAFKDNNEEVSSDVEFDLFDSEGKKVDGNGIVNAGSYTLKITSDKYELTGTTEITITVNKVDLSILKVNSLKDHFGAPYLPLNTAGYSYSELDLRFDTHVADSDENDKAADKEGWDALTYGTWGSKTKFEMFDEAKGEWVSATPGKAEGVVRVTLSGDENDAVNYEFANDDNTTVVEFLVIDADKLVFNDVKPGDWFFDVVFTAQANDWMNGYADGVLFGAHDQITRGQVACVLFNMAGEDMNENDSSYNEVFGWKSFDDVNGKAYYGEAIAWAKQAGVVNGYGDGTFAPDAPVTREELACMLANYAKKVDQADVSVEDADEVLGSVSDGASVSDWAKGSVAWAVENEIMGNGGFVNALSDITRAETAAMVVNYMA